MTMADAEALWISGQLAEKIRAHGAETYPHECCGALLGRDSGLVLGRDARKDLQTPSREILQLFPLVNRRDDSPRNRFSVIAEDVLAAEKAARDQGLEVVGWYHSHPDHPARPSQYDLDHAWPFFAYVIVSVRAGIPEEMTSWRLREDRSAFDQEELVMANKILIPTPLRPFTNKQEAVEVSGGTVGELLAELTRKYDGLRKHLYTDEGKLRSFVNVYVNDEDIRYLQRDQTPVKPGDTISIIPSVAGGVEAPAQPPALLGDEVKRYSRHLIMPEVGMDG